MPSEFRNEPFTDFSKEENANAMRTALAKVKSELGREYPLVIGGERIKTDGKLDSINPATGEVLATVAEGDAIATISDVTFAGNSAVDDGGGQVPAVAALVGGCRGGWRRSGAITCSTISR